MLPRVLIVEDDEIIREIYATKFQLEGFIVSVAENGQAGLQKLAEFKPHIVLLDMMMPVMGGLEFMERLDPAMRASLDIIIFSNVSSPGQTQAVMKLGASDFWTKSDYTPDRVARELLKRWQAKLQT